MEVYFNKAQVLVFVDKDTTTVLYDLWFKLTYGQAYIAS